MLLGAKSQTADAAAAGSLQILLHAEGSRDDQLSAAKERAAQIAARIDVLLASRSGHDSDTAANQRHHHHPQAPSAAPSFSFLHPSAQSLLEEQKGSTSSSASQASVLQPLPTVSAVLMDSNSRHLHLNPQNGTRNAKAVQKAKGKPGKKSLPATPSRNRQHLTGTKQSQHGT